MRRRRSKKLAPMPERESLEVVGGSDDWPIRVGAFVRFRVPGQEGSQRGEVLRILLGGEKNPVVLHVAEFRSGLPELERHRHENGTGGDTRRVRYIAPEWAKVIRRPKFADTVVIEEE